LYTFVCKLLEKRKDYEIDTVTVYLDLTMPITLDLQDRRICTLRTGAFRSLIPQVHGRNITRKHNVSFQDFRKFNYLDVADNSKLVIQSEEMKK